MSKKIDTSLTDESTKVFWLLALVNKIASFFGYKISVEKISKTSD